MSLLHTIHRVQQIVTEVFAAHAEKAGLDGMTARQAEVLRTIASIDGPSQTSLVTATGIDRSTIAEVCKRMVSKGWIERKRSKTDARAYTLKLSAKTAKLLPKINAAIDATDADLPARIKNIERLKIEKVAAPVDAAPKPEPTKPAAASKKTTTPKIAA